MTQEKRFFLFASAWWKQNKEPHTFWTAAQTFMTLALIGTTLWAVTLSGLSDAVIRILNANNDDLLRQRAMLQTDIKYKKVEIADLNKQITATNTELTSLGSQLKVANDQSAALADENRTFNRDMDTLYGNFENGLWNIAYPSVYYRCVQSLVVLSKSVSAHHQIVVLKGVEEVLDFQLSEGGALQKNVSVSSPVERRAYQEVAQSVFLTAQELQGEQPTGTKSAIKFEINAVYFRNPADFQQNAIGFYVEPLLVIGQTAAFSHGQSQEFRKIASRISGKVNGIRKKLVSTIEEFLRQPSEVDTAFARYGAISDHGRIENVLSVNVDAGWYVKKLTLYRAVVVQSVILRNLTNLLFPDGLPFTDKEFRDRLAAAIGGYGGSGALSAPPPPPPPPPPPAPPPPGP